MDIHRPRRDDLDERCLCRDGYPDTPIQIYNYSEYVGYRYFRYRAILLTNSVQSISPQVTGVSVDWSP